MGFSWELSVLIDIKWQEQCVHCATLDNPFRSTQEENILFICVYGCVHMYVCWKVEIIWGWSSQRRFGVQVIFQKSWRVCSFPDRQMKKKNIPNRGHFMKKMRLFLWTASNSGELEGMCLGEEQEVSAKLKSWFGSKLRLWTEFVSTVRSHASGKA